SAAERSAAASEDTCTPGAIAPPKNSPLAETTSTQIDEPKSTTIAALPYLWYAARQLTIRSAPTSLGLSTKSGIPVRTPGSINTCGTDGQYCSSINRTSCSTDGTVESPAAPVKCSESSPIRPSMVSASSSEVTSDSVRIRQCCTTLAWSPLPEIKPTTVCVLRTSIARSTSSIPPGQFVVRVRSDPGMPVDAGARSDVDRD